MMRQVCEQILEADLLQVMLCWKAISHMLFVLFHKPLFGQQAVLLLTIKRKAKPLT